MHRQEHHAWLRGRDRELCRADEGEATRPCRASVRRDSSAVTLDPTGPEIQRCGVTSPIGDTIPTLLAVDDSPSNLLALEALLDPLGYRIIPARSGEEALRHVAANDFVLILMDVHMPGLDGYQTTTLIRQCARARDVPIVFLTAVYHQPEHTHRGYALGAVDYIEKPFDAEVLRGKVRALVSLYTLGQRLERERNEEAQRIKDLFLGAVGHDLRGPLSAILLASQAMLRGDDCSDAQHRKLATRTERCARRMQGIIEDILDLVRGRFAVGIPLAAQVTNLGDVCRAVIEESRIARPERAMTLDASGDVSGCWDAGKLARVVSNLIGNAVDHSPDGAVDVRVSDRGDQVALEVHNQGRPIDPQVLPVLFEPFHRGDTSHNGLGLGLHIVREIVRAHHGSVDVRSTAADGTTFMVMLPRGKVGRERDLREVG